MIHRCNDLEFPAYGAKGIKVCDEWVNNWQSFKFWAELNGARKDYEIHRLDKDGDYCPGNCVWLSKEDHFKAEREQLTWNGVTKSVIEWAEDLGMRRENLVKRIRKYDIEKAMTTPKGGKLSERKHTQYTFNGETLTHNEWAKKFDIDRTTLRDRIRRLGIQGALELGSNRRAKHGCEQEVATR